MPLTNIRPAERVKTVRVTDETLSVDVLDGRTITVPQAWYPRLLHATPKQRKYWTIAGGGYGIHWPDIDEDLSSEGLLRGAPASRTRLPSDRTRPTKGSGRRTRGGRMVLLKIWRPARFAAHRLFD